MTTRRHVATRVDEVEERNDDRSVVGVLTGV